MNDALSSNERRAATRHKASLNSSVLMTAIKISDENHYTVLQGRLLDVSTSGLALIISGEDLTELEKLGDDIKLQLMLPLPAGAVELEATLARRQPFQDSGNSRVLLGAQITNMRGRDRILFMDFIRRQE